MTENWTGKKVLITGVAGTVGQELFRQLEKMDVAEIVGIDCNESELFFLEQSHLDKENIHFFLCDIKDRESLEQRMRGCDIVLHAAAFKHVGLCEYSPRSAVGTNIIGVQNVIDAATNAGVERVLFTSSDKAVNPSNVMGTSKLMGERLITAANLRRRKDDPIFGVTRFGNVLGSRGSVVPIFKQQIEKGEAVTVTDKDMSRFVMTLEEAADLVLETALIFKGGEVFITKMPIMNVVDLASVMIEELAPRNGYKPEDIEVKITGARPGEKLYEELLNSEEVRRSMESEKFFIIMPALEDTEYSYEDMSTSAATLPYTSANAEAMNKKDLRAYMYTHGLIEPTDMEETEKVQHLKVV